MLVSDRLIGDATEQTVPFLPPATGLQVLRSRAFSTPIPVREILVAATDSVTCYFPDKYPYQTAFVSLARRPAHQSSPPRRTKPTLPEFPPTRVRTPRLLALRGGLPSRPPQALGTAASWRRLSPPACPPPCRHRVSRDGRPCGHGSAGQNRDGSKRAASRSSPRDHDRARSISMPRWWVVTRDDARWIGPSTYQGLPPCSHHADLRMNLNLHRPCRREGFINMLQPAGPVLLEHYGCSSVAHAPRPVASFSSTFLP